MTPPTDPSLREIHEAIDDLLFGDHGEDAPDKALHLIAQSLLRYPDDIDLLSRQAQVLGSPALNRLDEALAVYAQQQRIFLAEDPPTPHRWQRCGFALYEQALLTRALGHLAEARALIGEAVARIGSFVEHPAWFQAGDWAWEDGDHNTAGRLWHDMLFKATGADALAPLVTERCVSLGDQHSHDWVWLARMRAQLSWDLDIDTDERQQRMDALFAHVSAHPMAWRLRARARQWAGDLEGASADLDHYLRLAADPKAQVWRCQLDHQMGRPHGLEELVWAEHPDLGGRDYYGAGCDYDDVIDTLRAEGQYIGYTDLARVKAVEARVYLLGAARFEHCFATGEGNSEDADPHVYAMLCNNLGIAGFYRQEKYAEAVAWHDKGWAVSTFQEQYDNRLSSQFFAHDWAGVIASYQTLTEHYGDEPGWGTADQAYYTAWAHDQLNQREQVLALYAQFGPSADHPLDAALRDVKRETKLVGLMALAAKAAALLRQRVLLERITDQLLTSDRLSERLCARLAQAWDIFGDPHEATRCAHALHRKGLPATPPAMPQPDIATLFAMAQSPTLNNGYDEMTLPALTPEQWQFKVATGATQGDTPVPIYVEVQRGADTGVPTWQLSLLRKPVGLLGRWRGQTEKHVLTAAHSPTGSAPPAEWEEVDTAALAPMWSELHSRFAQADFAWQQLTQTATLARVQDVLQRLAQHGTTDGQTLELGLCDLWPGTSRQSSDYWLAVLIDRNADGDPALPKSSHAPWTLRYQIVTGSEAPYLIYIYQESNDGPARQLLPGDTADVLMAHDVFVRAMRRFERRLVLQEADAHDPDEGAEPADEEVAA